MRNFTGTLFLNIEIETEQEASALLFEIEAMINEKYRATDYVAAQLADSFQDDDTGEEIDYRY